jgi:hypothetical protein
LHSPSKTGGRLVPEGHFVFSIEHPVATAQNPMQGWMVEEQGRKVCWPVDHYGEEGERKQSWFIDGVLKIPPEISCNGKRPDHRGIPHRAYRRTGGDTRGAGGAAGTGRTWKETAYFACEM